MQTNPPFKVTATNNGWSSDFFQLGRGVRQGCPLSPYLFILCVETLANAIRNNDGIKGICISVSECKLSQYADDTTLILYGSDNSVNTSLKLLDSFAELSGLNVNYEKTEALWIGSFRLQTRTIETNKNILWSFNKVFALGVWFSTIKEESETLNLQEKKEKINKKNRKLAIQKAYTSRENNSYQESACFAISLHFISTSHAK